MAILLIWLGLSVVVGVAANTRGRSGIGWFLLAAFISPLIAGLLVLALPAINFHDRNFAEKPAGEPIVTRDNYVPPPLFKEANITAFEPDGVYAGIPYRIVDGSAVLAVFSGGMIRFRDMDQFLAAARGETIAPKAK